MRSLIPRGQATRVENPSFRIPITVVSHLQIRYRPSPQTHIHLRRRGMAHDIWSGPPEAIAEYRRGNDFIGIRIHSRIVTSAADPVRLWNPSPAIRLRQPRRVQSRIPGRSSVAILRTVRIDAAYDVVRFRDFGGLLASPWETKLLLVTRGPIFQGRQRLSQLVVDLGEMRVLSSREGIADAPRGCATRSRDFLIFSSARFPRRASSS